MGLRNLMLLTLAEIRLAHALFDGVPTLDQLATASHKLAPPPFGKRWNPLASDDIDVLLQAFGSQSIFNGVPSVCVVHNFHKSLELVKP